MHLLGDSTTLDTMSHHWPTGLMSAKPTAWAQGLPRGSPDRAPGLPQDPLALASTAVARRGGCTAQARLSGARDAQLGPAVARGHVQHVDSPRDRRADAAHPERRPRVAALARPADRRQACAGHPRRLSHMLPAMGVRTRYDTMVGCLPPAGQPSCLRLSVRARAGVAGSSQAPKRAPGGKPARLQTTSATGPGRSTTSATRVGPARRGRQAATAHAQRPGPRALARPAPGPRSGLGASSSPCAPAPAPLSL